VDYYSITQYLTHLNVTTTAMQHSHVSHYSLANNNYYNNNNIQVLYYNEGIIKVLIIIIPFQTYIFASANFRTLGTKYQGIIKNFKNTTIIIHNIIMFLTLGIYTNEGTKKIIIRTRLMVLTSSH